MAYYFREKNCTIHCGLLLTFLFLEELIFIPLSFYCGVQLYRSLRATNIISQSKRYAHG